MKRFLLIGDPHARKDDLPELRRLIEWVKELCVLEDLTPLFLGDQFHSHGNVEVEVLEFWLWAFKTLEDAGHTAVALTGNHDGSRDMSSLAMSVYERYALVVTKPEMIQADEKTFVVAVPYYRDSSEFVQKIHGLYGPEMIGRPKYIICHQEFDGAQFENGYYSPHGVKLADLPKEAVFISGHIHKKQALHENGKMRIFYPGTPRHLVRSDAGEVKTVLIADFETDRFEEVLVPAEVCEPFQVFEVYSAEAAANVPNSAKVYVNVHGSQSVVDEILTKLPESAHVRTFVESDLTPVEYKESVGVNKTFAQYAERFFDENRVDPTDRSKVMDQILKVCSVLR